MDRRSLVVAQDRDQQVGCGANDGNVRLALEGQHACVLQQNKALLGGLARHDPILIEEAVGRPQFVELVQAHRVEQAELKARRIESFSGLCNQGLRHQSLADGIGQRIETRCPDAARQVRACLKREHRRVHHVQGFLVAVVHVVDGTAIRNHEALELPCLAQVLLQKHFAGAGRPAVDGVVGTHHALHMTLDHAGSEGWQVGLFKITRRYIHVEAVA